MTADKPWTSPKGLGLAQVRGQQIVDLNPGDAVFTPRG
jgi:hypothetical protein